MERPSKSQRESRTLMVERLEPVAFTPAENIYGISKWIHLKIVPDYGHQSIDALPHINGASYNIYFADA